MMTGLPWVLDKWHGILGVYDLEWPGHVWCDLNFTTGEELFTETLGEKLLLLIASITKYWNMIG